MKHGRRLCLVKMKRLICFVLIFMMSYVSCFAQDIDIKAYKEKDTNKLIELKINEPDQMAVAVIYTSDNRIYNSQIVNIKDKKAELRLMCPDTEFVLKLYTDLGTDKSYSVPSDKIEYYEKEFVPVYGNTAAAIGAFAVVKDVCEELNVSNEAVASLTVLYRGEECKVEFDIDYLLSYQESEESISVLDLEAGDIIRLKATLSGKLVGAEFIFKAPKTDVVLDEEEASRLYTTITDKKNMNVFGVVADVYDDTLVLYNQGGLERDALYLDIDPNTVVYGFDASLRKDNVKILSAKKIPKSEIFSKDEDDNITNWEEKRDRVYAYVRVYDGIVCDVMLYENY